MPAPIEASSKASMERQPGMLQAPDCPGQTFLLLQWILEIRMPFMQEEGTAHSRARMAAQAGVHSTFRRNTQLRLWPSIHKIRVQFMQAGPAPYSRVRMQERPGPSPIWDCRGIQIG